MNRRAKSDAASLILAGEIVTVQTHKKQTSKQTSTFVFWDGRIFTFTSVWVADSSDYGLLGEQSSSKWEISCPGRP